MQAQRTAAPRGLAINTDELEHWAYLVREQLDTDAVTLAEAETHDEHGAGFFERVALFARLAAEVERGHHWHPFRNGQEVERFREWLRATLFMEAESIHPEHDGPLVVIASQERVALCERLSVQLGGLIPDYI